MRVRARERTQAKRTGALRVHKFARTSARRICFGSTIRYGFSAEDNGGQGSRQPAMTDRAHRQVKKPISGKDPEIGF
ncbi:hypothetical protein [Paenibacillus chitinolyticus]|uniref:hypothetical protein n=1 Tax=Paenibacillus chitinolyticus TaxID=79263 RepID=UPI00366E3EDD